jgi:hypothetical protein
MADIGIIENALESTASEIDRAVAESAVAVECMELDRLCAIALSILNMASEWDRRVTRAVCTGKMSPESYQPESLKKLFDAINAVQRASDDAAELFEKRGYSVDCIEEIRKFKLDDFATFAVYSSAMGHNHNIQAKHLTEFMSEV